MAKKQILWIPFLGLVNQKFPKPAPQGFTGRKEVRACVYIYNIRHIYIIYINNIEYIIHSLYSTHNITYIYICIYPLKLGGPTLVSSCNRDCDVLELESKGPDSRMRVKG